MTDEEKTLFTEIIACREDSDKKLKKLMKYILLAVAIIIMNSTIIIVFTVSTNTNTIKELEQTHDNTIKEITLSFNDTLKAISEENNKTTQEFYNLYFGTDYDYGTQTITQTVETKE